MVARPRTERDQLGEEQAALRRVATLMAEGASSSDVFDAVALEVTRVLQLPNAAVCRFDDAGTSMTILAVRDDRPHPFEPGTTWSLDGPSTSAQILRTGKPARTEDYSDVPSTIAAAAREAALQRTAAAPIIVDGRVWGMISTSSPDAPFPERVEERLVAFTELVAIAIVNTQARADLARLADEQSALRRMATLVAQGVPPDEVFAAVVEELGRLLDADAASLCRYEADDSMIVVSEWSIDPQVTSQAGTRWPVNDGTAASLVFRTRRPARIASYDHVPGPGGEIVRQLGFRSSVAAPVMVSGQLWGVAIVLSKSPDTLPPALEGRLAEFTELVATAIANAEHREELTRLAEEQAALRRVATLVAEGATPTDVFSAVKDEVARMLAVPLTVLMRYDADGMVTLLATSGDAFGPVGTRWPVDGQGITSTVRATGRSVRIDVEAAHSTIGDAARRAGMKTAVGVPIVIDGALWGVIGVGSQEPEPLPLETEGRLAKFTELLATAIANAESRDELDVSRARIVTTADATRRRIERDLHDGAQQQLLSLALEVRAAEAAVPPGLDEQRSQLAHVAERLTEVLDGLREIALGIHPAILAEGGLGPALNTLARRSPVPVELDVRVSARLPEHVEVAAYYVVSETLTNAAKHADASSVSGEVAVRDGVLHVDVRDDGSGGADPARGSGLIGLKDRVEAMGGKFTMCSLRGDGTSVTVELPL